MKSIANRTEDFALRIVNACGWIECYLVEQKKFSFLELNKQLLRSGTSIGAIISTKIFSLHNNNNNEKKSIKTLIYKNKTLFFHVTYNV